MKAAVCIACLIAVAILLARGQGPTIPGNSIQSAIALQKTNAVIGYRTLTNLLDSGNTTEYTTPAFIPTAWALVIAAVVTSDTTLPDAHALTSLHGTWNQVQNANFNTLATPLSRVSVWYTMSATAISSTLTNKFAGAATGCAMFVCEFTGVNTNQPSGVGAIRQSVSQTADATANPSLSLGAAMMAHSRNAGYAAFANDLNPFGGIQEGGWTEDFDNGYNTPATGLYVAHILGTLDNSFSCTASSSDLGLIILEILVEQ